MQGAALRQVSDLASLRAHAECVQLHHTNCTQHVGVILTGLYSKSIHVMINDDPSCACVQIRGDATGGITLICSFADLFCLGFIIY